MSLPTPSPTSTAVVTGASSGIGADLARELARRGHGVTLVARRGDLLEELARELSPTVRVEVVACDLTDADARGALLDTVAGRGLDVDVLVNNAGMGTMGPVSGADLDRELAQVRLNVEALTELTTRAVQLMVPRGRGAILNVGSVASYNPYPGQAVYAATKAYVHSYTEALRTELRGSGVSVSVLAPGPVRSGFIAAAGMDESAVAAAFPAALWEEASDVARAGLDGLAADHAVTVPGVPMRLASRLVRLVPHRVLLPALAARHPGLR